MSDASPAAPPRKFFRIAIGLLAAWLLCVIGAGLLLVTQAEDINRSGGWGWILVLALFVAVTGLFCLGCLICTAVSLRRGEAHRRVSIAILIVSGLVVWRVGLGLAHGVIEVLRQYTEAPRAAEAPPRSPGRTPLPESLVGHFRSQGILLKPEGRFAHQATEWIFENAGVGPRCEVVVSFAQFWTGAPVEAIRKDLADVSTPSVLNEREKMAMFHPFARGKTSDRADCEGWSAKSDAIVTQLQAAFLSYPPAPAGR